MTTQRKMHLRNRPGSLQSVCLVNGASVALPAKDFKAWDPDNRCWKCEREFLKRRNAQRKSKGLEPVQHIN